MSGSKPVTATREFAADFAKVTQHYGCTESEITEIKQLARSDMPSAVQSFGLMAKEIN